jgi:salicylate hydroxylase
MTTQISPNTLRQLQEGRTGRVLLHKLLLSEVTVGVISYGKKVLRPEKLENSARDYSAVVRLHFEDGSTKDADLVVASDGLYSVGFPTCIYSLPRR